MFLKSLWRWYAGSKALNVKFLWITSSLELTFICFDSHLFHWKYIYEPLHVRGELLWSTRLCRRMLKIPCSITAIDFYQLRRFIQHIVLMRFFTSHVIIAYLQHVHKRWWCFIIIIDCHDTINDLQSANTIQLLSSFFFLLSSAPSMSIQYLSYLANIRFHNKFANNWNFHSMFPSYVFGFFNWQIFVVDNAANVNLLRLWKCCNVRLTTEIKYRNCFEDDEMIIDRQKETRLE